MSFSGLLAKDPNGGIPGLFRGRSHAWSFNTRVAIRAACDLLDLKPGDEVLAPAYNCGTEIDPLLDAGLSVSLYPVHPHLEIDPDIVRNMITSKTRALYITHYFGFVQPHMKELRQLCDEHGLRMIEDCALSLLSGSAPVDGRTGDISVFCLYKFFPLIGGGVLVANAADVDDIDIFHRGTPSGETRRATLRAALGGLIGAKALYNGMSNLRALLGRDKARMTDFGESDQLLPDMPANYYYDQDLNNSGLHWLTRRSLDSFDTANAIAQRRSNWKAYQAILTGITGLTLLNPDLPTDACPLNFPVLVKNRRAICTALQTAGVDATEWWAGYHQGVDWAGQSDARYLKESVLALPLHQYMQVAHIQYISELLIELLRVQEK